MERLTEVGLGSLSGRSLRKHQKGCQRVEERTGEGDKRLTMLARTFRSAWLTAAASPPGMAKTFSALARAVCETKRARTSQLRGLKVRPTRRKYEGLTPAVSELIWKSA